MWYWYAIVCLMFALIVVVGLLIRRLAYNPTRPTPLSPLPIEGVEMPKTERRNPSPLARKKDPEPPTEDDEYDSECGRGRGTYYC